MRSFTFPKLSLSNKQSDNMMSESNSPYQTGGGHSRESSATSSASSPNTPTFSAHGHNRWPSSSSSLASAPDSPVNVAKPPLHDLVEVPAEMEDFVGTEYPIYNRDEHAGMSTELAHDSESARRSSSAFRTPIKQSDEPLCICDTSFCEHRVRSYSQSSVTSPMSEWSPGDDNSSDADLSIRGPFNKRRRSGELSPSVDPLRRWSRRWPSLSKHKRDQLVSPGPAVRSAPTSRPNSIKQQRPPQFEHRSISNQTPPITPMISHAHLDMQNTPKGPPAPIEVQQPYTEDPIGHRELASTPLLPPMMDTRNVSREQIQSHLQSPTVAAVSSPFLGNSTPSGTPNMLGLPTPPLSSKPSTASFNMVRQGNLVPSSEIPSMAISEEPDKWAAILGHANFHIYPEPYCPQVPNLETSKQLRKDWEAARSEYMRHSHSIGEQYGITSKTYQDTEKKWAEIDAQWHATHTKLSSSALVGEDTETKDERTRRVQALAESAPSSKLLTSAELQQSGKFPTIDDDGIVGPMVTFAKFGVQRRPSRKATFLKLFTDPASLLGRNAFSPRR